jgi:hypothetical protein
MAYNEYFLRIDQLRAAKQYTLDCIDVVFINSGNATAYIEGLELAPGTNFALTGNLGEICKQGVNISFGTGTNPFLQIVQRQYK